MNSRCGFQAVASQTDPQLDFEKALKELEELVETMERGELSLEESLKSFERGIQLTRACQQALREAEQKVEILTEGQGPDEVRPLDERDE
ncbi:MAG: exodeoxyribonuclease VII small subunit [Gammaproteobacteria bacterium]|nr:exodeoxyribonuclease VII small subunit [Gammaproteobacteria bacterium]NIR85882.1 exodeoxyribonuclease VII small subunit [Gammaproteobacteria bacterium]NIR90849.1 exodeoxyribonuclease VII small subunit [Gammaproteobacteria bacterium]